MRIGIQLFTLMRTRIRNPERGGDLMTHPECEAKASWRWSPRSRGGRRGGGWRQRSPPPGSSRSTRPSGRTGPSTRQQESNRKRLFSKNNIIISAVERLLFFTVPNPTFEKLWFRFRFHLIKSSGSGSGSYFWKVTVPVPAPYLDHKKLIFLKNYKIELSLGRNEAFFPQSMCIRFLYQKTSSTQKKRDVTYKFRQQLPNSWIFNLYRMQWK